MVLLNGLLSDTTMWAGALPELCRDFRVLTFDSRGQGKSDAPEEGPYPTSLLAEEAWELMEILGVERPWLVGLSNGASISLELLSARPGAFRGGVLVSALSRMDFAMDLKVRHWAGCLEQGGPLLLFDAVAPFLWGDAFLEARHAVLRAYHQVVSGDGRPEALRGALHQIMGALGWDIRERLGRIVDPLLLLCGEEDLLTPPWKCRQTASFIGGALFEVVPGIGHAYPVEAPRPFAARVLEFVRAHPA